MGQFQFTKTGIEGLVVVEPKVFGDKRGYFMETYNYNDFKAAGLDMVFVQDNQSKSKKGVLRGLLSKEKPSGQAGAGGQRRGLRRRRGFAQGQRYLWKVVRRAAFR